MSDDEKCVRCGDVGEDRRTLFMECFYDMRETGVPFDEKFFFSTDLEKLEQVNPPAVVTLPGPLKKQVALSAGKYRTSEDLSPRGFFTLRVCKECRGEWIRAIEQWFFAHRSQYHDVYGEGAVGDGPGAPGYPTED